VPVSASRVLKSDGRLVLLVSLHSPADEWVSGSRIGTGHRVFGRRT
jgi:hypothetical protein